MTKFYPSEEVFGLPNIKSAKKRVLVNQTKAARNKAAKSALKTQLKYFDAAIIEGNPARPIRDTRKLSRLSIRLPLVVCCTRTPQPTARAR